MFPVITLGPVELSSYALLLAIGGSVGFWLTFREMERAPLGRGSLLGLAALSFTASLVGARALSLLLHRRQYVARPWWSLFAIWDAGGLAFYGGLALSVAVGLFYIRRRRLPAGDTADRLVAAWLPFLFLVRIGCFLNGCCYGRPTTSALGLVAGGAPNAVNFGIASHPTQLYEAAALLAIFALVRWMRPRRRFAGQLAVAFLALHSVARFFLEPLRGDPRGGWSLGAVGTLTLNQAIALALFAASVGAGVRLYSAGTPAPALRRSRNASTPARASGSE
jgi:phosphatidylglycerol---prolipoprotein diacylglyceryl transferase